MRTGMNEAEAINTVQFNRKTMCGCQDGAQGMMHECPV